MLKLDDEPLNLILNEAKITENNYEFIKKIYHEVLISEEEIKTAIIELKKDNMIILLDDNGRGLDVDINKIIDSKEPFKYWFSITQKGKYFFEENYFSFWKE
jgi:hypothetical protein